MRSSIHPLWTGLLLLVCFSGFSFAFGAGNIPDYAFLEGKAFRHGDIEDVLAELLIRATEVSSGAIGFAAKSVGKKFSKLNVKRTYFGNWLYETDPELDLIFLGAITRKHWTWGRYRRGWTVPPSASLCGFLASCPSAMRLANSRFTLGCEWANCR